jgi:hypothetical protein
MHINGLVDPFTDLKIFNIPINFNNFYNKFMAQYVGINFLLTAPLTPLRLSLLI